MKNQLKQNPHEGEREEQTEAEECDECGEIQYGELLSCAACGALVCVDCFKERHSEGEI